MANFIRIPVKSQQLGFLSIDSLEFEGVAAYNKVL